MCSRPGQRRRHVTRLAGRSEAGRVDGAPGRPASSRSVPARVRADERGNTPKRAGGFGGREIGVAKPRAIALHPAWRLAMRRSVTVSDRSTACHSPHLFRTYAAVSAAQPRPLPCSPPSSGPLLSSWCSTSVVDVSAMVVVVSPATVVGVPSSSCSCNSACSFSCASSWLSP